MSTALVNLEKNLALGNIESYISWANQIPALSHAEELELTNKLKKDGDLEAAKKLVLHHLRFVIHVAKGYIGYGLPLADLIQEGNIGLMKAVKKFDPSNGVRLVSYAIHWIKSEIHEYVIKNIKAASGLAPTKNLRKLFFRLRSLKSSLTDKKWLTHEQVKIVADKLNVSEKEVMIMEQRLEPHTDISLDFQETNDEYSQNENANERYLEDHSTQQDKEIEQINWNLARTNNLATALNALPERERSIIELRWLKEQKSTLNEIAIKLKVSKERVRQLEKKAIESLKSNMQKIT
jgi:RNA polymerase sigma-32 factor